MRNIKITVLGLLVATLLTTGLYSCNNNTTPQDTTASSQDSTNFKMKYQNLTYEIINENLFHIIDVADGVHPVTYTSNSNLTLIKISDTEASLFEETTQKEYAKLQIIDIQEDFVFMDVTFHNGINLSNIEMPKSTLGWGKLVPIIVEVIEGIFDYIKGGDTALPEMVIFDMSECYKNHQIAMQNCVGGSVSLIADQSTGLCSIGNCVVNG